MKDLIVFIVGPTAVGKSAVALKLAKKINAEILSCDSMQVYKGMDILTSKPSRSARGRIKHHLIDILPVTKEYNVARYRNEALKIIRNIHGRGKVPLFVGGSGLYMSILIDGLFQIKAKDARVREKLYAQAQNLGSHYLHKKLTRIDPQSASGIHPNDTRRIVRALEVYLVSGNTLSELKKRRKGLDDDYKLKLFCLNEDRDRLYAKIDKRVDKMFRQGALNEARRLIRKKMSRTANLAIGLKEIRGYLDGAYDLDEAKRLLKRNTRLYAKRQLTWFRKDKRIDWLEVGVKDTASNIANKIFRRIKLCN
jgi:tRNA dimethylallyltransferase